MADERERPRRDAAKPEPEKSKKEKKEKPGKAELPEKPEIPEKPEKQKKEPKEKKEHPRLKTFFFTNLFWLVALLVFTAFTFLNMFTLKEIVLQFLNPEDDYEVVFESDIRAMDEYIVELDQRAQELEDWENELGDYETELDQRANELDMLQYSLEEKYPDASDEDSQALANPIDINVVAKAIGEMDPAAAARSLILIPPDTTAKILTILKADKAGAIMSKMIDTDLATILELMTEPQ